MSTSNLCVGGCGVLKWLQLWTALAEGGGEHLIQFARYRRTKSGEEKVSSCVFFLAYG